MDGRGFMFPVDTTIGKDGRMHTVSRAYAPATAQLRITMYDIDSEYFGIYGGYGEGLGEFRWPTGMASDENGNVYVSDELNNRINVFSHEGDPIKYWGDPGSSEGELNGPSGIAFDSDENLFVADHMNNKSLRKMVIIFLALEIRGKMLLICHGVFLLVVMVSCMWLIGEMIV